MYHQKSKKVPEKNIYFCFIDYAKAFICVDHNKLWKILKEMGIPDHLTCLLRNLYVGQEATVRIGHGTTAAAAKSRQSCPTLCDPIDGSPPSSRPRDSPGKNTGVGCHWLLQWNNRLVPNQERSTSRLYIVTLLI